MGTEECPLARGQGEAGKGCPPNCTELNRAQNTTQRRRVELSRLQWTPELHKRQLVSTAPHRQTTGAGTELCRHTPLLQHQRQGSAQRKEEAGTGTMPWGQPVQRLPWQEPSMVFVLWLQ